jgi:hypothetical protein
MVKKIPDVASQGWKSENVENLLIFVTRAKHGRKCGDLLLAAANLAGLFEIALGTDIANDTFSVKAFLQAAEGPFDGLTFANLYFYGHI